jgi:hypothetical protein
MIPDGFLTFLALLSAIYAALSTVDHLKIALQLKRL